MTQIGEKMTSNLGTNNNRIYLPPSRFDRPNNMGRQTAGR